MDALRIGLFGVGYAGSIAVIARFVPVVREQRWRWLAFHHVAVGALITGFWLEGTVAGVAVNSGWLVVSSAWYLSGLRRQARDQASAEAGVKVAFSQSSSGGNS